MNTNSPIINKWLKKIEKKNSVDILLAVESGSRAWGFASSDSDYDVRFIYVNPVDRYLSVFPERDVIEVPISGKMDINGWDIKKAFQLLSKSNPVLIEWLNSPVVYRLKEWPLAPLKELAEAAFQPKAGYHHYLSMAYNNMSKVKDRSRVKIKSYLYTLRPLLCCRWIIEKKTIPPVRFAALVDEFLDKNLRSEVARLLEIKKSTSEGDTVEKSATLDRYLQAAFTWTESNSPRHLKKFPSHAFDDAFRKVLLRVAPKIHWTAGGR